MGKFRDYDEAWAARESGPSIRVYGEDVELPPSPPAKVFLKVAAIAKEHGDDAEIPADLLTDMMSSIIGADRLERWLDKGMDFEQLGQILADYLADVGAGDGGDESGEAEPPATGD